MFENFSSVQVTILKRNDRDWTSAEVEQFSSRLDSEATLPPETPRCLYLDGDVTLEAQRLVREAEVEIELFENLNDPALKQFVS